MKKIAILVSGNGSNMINIYNYFRNEINISVTTVISDRKCNAINFCIEKSIDYIIVDRKTSNFQYELIHQLSARTIDLIVLAGFLSKIPLELINIFRNKIINLHPSLLPKYGGKGMYGHNVFRAVLDNKETVTGITFHYVDENYDTGNIIQQYEIKIKSDDTIESLGRKTHQLEYEFYPKIIEEILNN